jgi:hypothetical protein
VSDSDERIGELAWDLWKDLRALRDPNDWWFTVIPFSEEDREEAYRLQREEFRERARAVGKNLREIFNELSRR